MSAEEVNALVITPPLDGEVFAVTGGAVSASDALPEEFDNSWITVRCIGSAVTLNFSVGAGTADPASVSAGFPLAPAANRGVTLQVGAEVPYFLGRIKKAPQDRIHINYISATAGSLEFWRSSGPVE